MAGGSAGAVAQPDQRDLLCGPGEREVQGASVGSGGRDEDGLQGRGAKAVGRGARFADGVAERMPVSQAVRQRRARGGSGFGGLAADPGAVAVSGEPRRTTRPARSPAIE